MAQFIGNIIVRGKIECLTGLHIGAGKDTAEIGGVDSPVVRDPRSRLPYIPGSSLKGKMRSMLEFATDKVGDGKVHNCDNPRCEVCRPFGSSAQQRKCGPTRLLVRDAYPDGQTREMWEKLNTDLLYAEMKSENFLDRITSAANPRFIERVVKGSCFKLEMVYGVYQMEDGVNDLDYFAHVVSALRLLEDGALGGNGSRGYGQIRLKLAYPAFLSRQDYAEGSDAWAGSRQWPDDTSFVHGVGDFSLDRKVSPCPEWDKMLQSPAAD